LSHHAYDALLTGDDAAFPDIPGLKAIASPGWRFSLGDLADVWHQAELIATWAVERQAAPSGEERLQIRGAAVPFDRTALAAYEDDGLTVSLTQFDTASIAE